MYKLALLLLLNLGFVAAHAQQDSLDLRFTKTQNDTTPGSVIIHEPEKITRVMEALGEADLPLEGYRIQLSFGRKSEVNEIRTNFLKSYPEYGAYVSWLQPNFRLRVGDFRTRLHAERFKNQIRDEYPASYIVRDYIEPAQD